MKTLDILGEQLLRAVRFMEAGFEDSIMHDTVLAEDVPAHVLFLQKTTEAQTPMWVMRNESIPGHFSVKSIAVDPTTLYIETAPLDPEKTQEVVAGWEPAIKVLASNGRSFVDVATSKTIAWVGKVVTIKHGTGKLAPRALWKIDLKMLNGKERETAIAFIDTLFTEDAFDLVGMEQESGHWSAPAKGHQIELRLQLQLLHQLKLEQRPMLALGIAGSIAIDTRLELQALLSLQGVILRMTPDQLESFVAEYAEKHGVRDAERMMLFVLAGRVKREAPELTWKAARRIARQLARAPAA